ncbi:helix-turn-helix transcriptional regulator [Undibacter mobilis]|uniref:XRE family transcriptional regulator n=1 Tax=Undibacter mobilis TaxID=2292256 RepID=A0A371BD53_9BRAD|nr:helix-turn-helix transcriptional regulator [Undibacter mobilis]RDV05437.1 XRE family transcriptional regulator [Undibacter mobilis]
MPAAANDEKQLGLYLKDRRAKLDPAAFGLPLTRRRTPGLRREEVAQRAHVSATWYTWLEQGRGGAPSADVLDRIARALMLTQAEREHLFFIGLGRAPDAHAHVHADQGVSPRLQRLIDSMELNPAVVKTTTWDVVAWNKAAAAVLTDYAKLPPNNRNILRIIFADPYSRARQKDWHAVARFVVAAFRADAARSGASDKVKALVDELSAASPDFAAMWRENDVRHYGEGTKNIRSPKGDMIGLEYSSFAVDGRPDLGLVVYTPATVADAAKVKMLVKGKKKKR